MSTVVTNGIITGRPGFEKRWDSTLMTALVIEYWILEFIAILDQQVNVYYVRLSKIMNNVG
jgi:hypothetical protein